VTGSIGLWVEGAGQVSQGREVQEQGERRAQGPRGRRARA
jgi:hypothetical protein